MAGQKKKPRYSEETLWFLNYYIGWIGIGNCGQKTSIMDPQGPDCYYLSTLAKKNLDFPFWYVYVRKLFDALHDMIISNSHNYDVLTSSAMTVLTQLYDAIWTRFVKGCVTSC